MSRPDDDSGNSSEDEPGELGELEGPEHEMEGEAEASEESLAKERPAPHHQLGERA